MSKELDDAVFSFCHPGVSLMEHEKAIVEERMKYFKAGAAWAEKHSPRVLALVEALDGADSILVCAGFPNADLMDIVETAQKRLTEALAAWREE